LKGKEKMAVSIEDIKKLRAMTGAGLADVKNALNEAEGDFDKAKEILRERGLAIAAKRSDRETSNGCVLVKAVDGFAAMVAVKCETDFVANGKDFIAMVQEILDAAVAAKAKSLDEVKALKLANGEDAATTVQQRSGITGEKMELDGYNFIEGENLSVYDHMGKHTLATIVQLSKNNEDAAHKVAMQVAAMKPVALNEASVPQEVKEEEYKVAIQKTKEEQVEKAVVAAIKKAGINANLVDSDDHIESNINKGWLTREDADKAIEIRKTVSAEKAANLNENMIENIAKGRLSKFFKDNCLVDQEFQFAEGDKINVADWLKSQDKDLAVVAYKRFTLSAE
jgi:translation elongation factor Ts